MMQKVLTFANRLVDVLGNDVPGSRVLLHHVAADRDQTSQFATTIGSSHINLNQRRGKLLYNTVRLADLPSISS